MPTQITALAVSKAFDGRPVLDSVSCSLAQGERTGIVGENGSGKTTLLRLLAGRVRPDRGGSCCGPTVASATSRRARDCRPI